jgi:hypothetical protein
MAPLGLPRGWSRAHADGLARPEQAYMGPVRALALPGRRADARRSH